MSGATIPQEQNKLATQVGTQRHEFENFNRVREMIRDGAIAASWWKRRLKRGKLRAPGYLLRGSEPPKTQLRICEPVAPGPSL